MIIKDGTGSGKTVKVSSENQLLTSAVVETLDRHTNRNQQKVWSLPFDAIDPVGADDYFIYIENTGTKNLFITDIRIRSTVAGTVEVHRTTGTVSYAASVDITPVNRFLGDVSAPTAVIKTDTNATGLSNGGVLFYIRCAVVDTQYHLKTSATIIIPPGQQVSFLWDTSTGALSGTVSLVEDV